MRGGTIHDITTFVILYFCVLAPLLFSIFILDMFAGIDGDHCKFTDDGTFWHSGEQVHKLVEKICKDIGILKDWCRKWRMQISLPKTEITLFSQNIIENQEPVVTIRGLFKYECK